MGVYYNREKTNKSSGSKQTEQRYCINSKLFSVVDLISITCRHWSIENKLYLTVDVKFWRR